MKREVINFLINLKGKVKIITHRDVDGLCALAILLNFLKKRSIEEEHEFHEAYIDKLEVEKNMIFLDISLDNISKFVTDNTLVIDHHPFTKRIDNVIFYNPREEDPNSYLPAAYLVYEVISEIENIAKLKWIAALGIVGDKGEENSQVCRDFIKEFDKEKLELVAKFIFSAELVNHNEGLEKSLQILLNSKSIDDVLKNSYLRDCYENVQKEILNSKKKIEKEGNVIFVELNTKYNIKAIVASKILEKYRNIVVVAYYFRENYCYISGRTNTTIDIGKIFKKVAESCEGVGGGHEKAAGARISKDKINLFKEELLNEIDELT